MDRQQIKEIADRFGDKFFDATGTIEGGDGTPVTLGLMTTTDSCVAEYAAEWGCAAGEQAILVDWLPAGLEHDDPKPGEFPREKGVNPVAIPAPDTWVVFPRMYEGLKVFYRRGEQAFAL